MTPYLTPQNWSSYFFYHYLVTAILSYHLSANAIPRSTVSAPRDERICSQIRTSLVPDSDVSAPRDERVCSQIRADALLFSFIISDIP